MTRQNDVVGIVYVLIILYRQLYFLDQVTEKLITYRNIAH